MKAIPDLDRRELVILAPLVVLVIFYGVYPMPVMDVTAVSVEALIADYEAALAAAEAAGESFAFFAGAD